MANIRINDIEHHGDILLVKIRNHKGKILRSFAIDAKFTKIVVQYERLRPPHADFNRFFLNYQQGKCTNQAIGKNKFGRMPSEIAKYLNLPDANLFTGHSFRKTSETLLGNTDNGANNYKRLGE